MIQTMLFVSGMNTLLQTWFGTRLPVVIGGSFRFIIPSLYVAFAQRYYSYLNPIDVSSQNTLTLNFCIPLLQLVCLLSNLCIYLLTCFLLLISEEI